MLLLRRGLALALLLAAGTAGGRAHAEVGAASDHLELGAYVQPQFVMRQNSVAQGDEDGFVLRRLRLLGQGTRTLGEIDVGLRLEIELVPDATLLDASAFLHAEPLPWLGVDVLLGQHKTPLGRQQLLSDSRLGFVNKAQLASLTPDRQIGATVHLSLPWSRVSFGVYNGDGKNVTTATDEHQMVVGRVAFQPFGDELAPVEGGTTKTVLVLGAAAARNTRDLGDTSTETKTWLSLDGYASWNGISASAEYLLVSTEYGEGAPDIPFDAEGVVVQAAYLAPLPGWFDRKLEVGLRFEEIDRNDTVPIQQPGNDTQSLRTFTGALTLYLDGHDLKVQVEASHIVELEDRTFAGADATLDNDVIFVQITARR